MSRDRWRNKRVMGGDSLPNPVGVHGLPTVSANRQTPLTEAVPGRPELEAQSRGRITDPSILLDHQPMVSGLDEVNKPAGETWLRPVR